MKAIHDIPAPAKLNLFLHIVGRRADGYHLLQSVFVLVDCHDTLHIERRGDSRLQRHDLGEPLPADDLCLRAARALQAASGTTWGADLHLQKNLPTGAGMGGGSSDAASTLLALNRLWGLHWPRERLLALGQTLGADVPFFIGGHNAWVEGIGERLTPIDLPATDFLVVKPPCSLSTQALFMHPDLPRDTNAAKLSDFPKTALGSVASAESAWHNDFESLARRLCPDVALAIETLASCHGNARMTGSGSAVFAVVPREGGEAFGAVAAGQSAVDGRTACKGGHVAAPPGAQALFQGRGWWERRCTSLAAHPLADWVGPG